MPTSRLYSLIAWLLVSVSAAQGTRIIYDLPSQGACNTMRASLMRDTPRDLRGKEQLSCKRTPQ